jgi:L-ascorbate metabolism protein UlaG (beta-lactamase superfamily)
MVRWMRLQLIRNATLRLSYAGRELLVDPSLDPARAWPAIELLLNPQPNPIVELPLPAEQVVAGIDGVLVSHLHPDHFDARARELVARDTPLLHQPADGKQLEEDGFTRLTGPANGETVSWLGVDVTRVGGEHGFGFIAKAAGPVSGFVLSAEEEPTLYIAGDTVWCEDVETTLQQRRPDVVAVNAGDARTANQDRIIMDGDDVERVLEAAPDSMVVAIHLEAIGHCVLGRAELKQRLQPLYGSRLAVPDDGETVSVSAA